MKNGAQERKMWREKKEKKAKCQETNETKERCVPWIFMVARFLFWRHSPVFHKWKLTRSTNLNWFRCRNHFSRSTKNFQAQTVAMAMCSTLEIKNGSLIEPGICGIEWNGTESRFYLSLSPYVCLCESVWNLWSKSVEKKNSSILWEVSNCRRDYFPFGKSTGHWSTNRTMRFHFVSIWKSSGSFTVCILFGLFGGKWNEFERVKSETVKCIQKHDIGTITLAHRCRITIWLLNKVAVAAHNRTIRLNAVSVSVSRVSWFAFECNQIDLFLYHVPTND